MTGSEGKWLYRLNIGDSWTHYWPNGYSSSKALCGLWKEDWFLTDKYPAGKTQCSICLGKRKQKKVKVEPPPFELQYMVRRDYWGYSGRSHIKDPLTQSPLCGTRSVQGFRGRRSPSRKHPECKKCRKKLDKMTINRDTKIPKVQLCILRFENNRQFNPLDPSSWDSLPASWDAAAIHRNLITAIDKSFIEATDKEARKKKEEAQRKKLEEKRRKQELEEKKKRNLDCFVRDATLVFEQIEFEIATHRDAFVQEGIELQKLIAKEWEELPDSVKRFTLLDLTESVYDEVKGDLLEDKKDSEERFGLLELD